MRKINKLGRRAAALVLAVGLTLSTAAPVLAADADEVQTPAAQTEQQETDTEADEADVDTEADEAAALPELSEDREVAEEDEAVALPELGLLRRKALCRVCLQHRDLAINARIRLLGFLFHNSPSNQHFLRSL